MVVPVLLAVLLLALLGTTLLGRDSVGTTTSDTSVSETQHTAAGPRPNGVAPTSPSARICGNATVLSGPVSPPAGAVRVDPGQNANDLTQSHPAATMFWLAPGTHTLNPSPYGQIIPKSGNSYIGGPSAVLDGLGVNRYAFTQKAVNVTVKYLTIRNFIAPGDEGVVNHDAGAGWVIEHNTVEKNGGAGVFLGDDNRLSYNCLADNSQYGFQGSGANLAIAHNEIARNNTYDWETKQPGCGCSGGSKFWAAGPAVIVNNWIHGNHNVGLWIDNNNVGFLIEGNYIADNRSHGILYETSYNARIALNTFVRNAIGHGKEYQSRGDPFPIGSIYVSESGGDPRINGGTYATFEITANVFENNWSGVVLWENADRFGHDESANTSKGYTTLTVDMTNEGYNSPFMARCGDPATGGRITTEPFYSDCRWKAKNVAITDNDFRFDKATIGCTSDLCGKQGMFSNWGTVPTWSPYKGAVVQHAITSTQNNRFSNNRYVGDWHFTAHNVGNVLGWDRWRKAPYNQDLDSVITR